MKVLFVCLGNICRSPMAEAMFRHITDESFIIDSAGTSAWNTGQEPHKGTQEVLKKHNISYENMYARQITQNDFETFDLIIAMDKNNVKDLKRICPPKHQDKIKLFLDISEKYRGQDVPDPWYTGDFDTTDKLISEACLAWKNYITKGSE